MKKLIKIKNNAGMSYIELIVVLSIFAVISSVVIFNYGDFQAKVDIKNLASDIALQVVQAQKSSMSGLLSTLTPVSPWKPSYGVYFDMTLPKQFIYFVDLNNAYGYEPGETLNTISITKNNYIYRIDKCTNITCTSPSSVSAFSVVFKRPDSSAIFTGVSVASSEYIQITIKSPKGVTSLIQLY